MKPIVYPILFRFDDMTVPEGDEFPASWNLRHLGNSVYETPERVRPDARFHWLIDGDAQLREFTLTGKRREWARPLRYIWSFVRVRYELEEGRPITVGMLRQLIADTRLDEDKSLTPALNRFLKGHSDSELFSKAMFLLFMNGDASDEEAKD